MKLQYDEAELLDELQQLSRASRVAFATACAQRLMPSYERFSAITGRGDTVRLSSIIDTLWRDLQGMQAGDHELRRALQLAAELLPDDEHGWVREQSAADDYVAALTYALRCRISGEAQDAVWAARRAYNALDDFVVNSLHLDLNEKGLRDRIMSHPAVQAELERQRRDIADLRREPAAVEVITCIRDRAIAEPISLVWDS
jgi:uncharacterized protein YjaG (DUF416 family)